MNKEEFADSFFEVYDKLEATKKDHGDAMPAYFRFLTIMAFHVFLKEKVGRCLKDLVLGLKGQDQLITIIDLKTYTVSLYLNCIYHPNR